MYCDDLFVSMLGTINPKDFEISVIILFIGAQAAFLSCASIIEKIVSEIFKKEKLILQKEYKELPEVPNFEFTYKGENADTLRRYVSNYLIMKPFIYVCLFVGCITIHLARAEIFIPTAILMILISVFIIVACLFYYMSSYKDLRSSYGTSL